jgi:hypothetical protein
VRGVQCRHVGQTENAVSNPRLEKRPRGRADRHVTAWHPRLTVDVQRLPFEADERRTAILCLAGQAGQPAFDLRVATRQ